MRLIDADKIPEVSLDPKEEKAFRDTIAEQPTVEAITVEWIKKYVEKNRNYSPATVREITAMLDEWRRDNGDHS